MSATEEEISRKAYEIWDTNGRRHGMDRDDWIAAEQMLTPKEAVKLRGSVDVATPSRIAGWVRSDQDLETPVTVAVLVDGRSVAEMEASLFRQDLKNAGIGNGCFSFDFAFEPDFWPPGRHAIEITCPALGLPAPGERKTIDDLEAAIVGA